MKAIVRNVILACLVSTFALFGAIAKRPADRMPASAAEVRAPSSSFLTERQKETFTCLSVAALAWVLCFWRCGVINRRLRIEREYRQLFNNYMYAKGHNYGRY